MVKKFEEDRDIYLYCDFHAHSRKKNVFVCKDLNRWMQLKAKRENEGESIPLLAI